MVSNLLLPIGSLIYLLFCVTRWGWGFDNYLTEANTGKGLRLPRWFKPYFSVVLPLLIVFILCRACKIKPYRNPGKPAKKYLPAANCPKGMAWRVVFF